LAFRCRVGLVVSEQDTQIPCSRIRSAGRKSSVTITLVIVGVVSIVQPIAIIVPASFGGADSS
jgi:hypothetical protein